MSLLLEVDNPAYEKARDDLAGFTELVKSPEHMHTYRISPLSLWNAAASGISLDAVRKALEKHSKYQIPANIFYEIQEYYSRYGKLRLIKKNGDLILESRDAALFREITLHKKIHPCIEGIPENGSFRVKGEFRGILKKELIKLGFPVEDIAGYIDGDKVDIGLKKRTRSNREFCLRLYQEDAAQAFYAAGSVRGGCGAIVLPCGSGKTIVGMAVMAKVRMYTLILTTNITAIHQWREELLDKTTLSRDQIGEYSGESKNIRPVTLATYQIITYRSKKGGPFPHFELFNRENWGLIIYDEVHLLPAPVFRLTADIQARRRLGLTATMVREDNREDEVFSLIGPKKYDVPWKTLEEQGWIATADCTEIRVDMENENRLAYAVSENRKKIRMASENPMKTGVVRELLQRHSNDLVLIIGQYLDQLNGLAGLFRIPLITGKTPNNERDVLYQRFRTGRIKQLVVSKVGNFAVDLPDANVAVQVSGTFGSRQEEAQRLGRILRPKSDGTLAHFYSIVTKDTREQDFAMNRQLFLTEQGYKYRIMDAGTFLHDLREETV
jgi:DNA excision repair protein ERCC-3